MDDAGLRHTHPNPMTAKKKKPTQPTKGKRTPVKAKAAPPTPDDVFEPVPGTIRPKPKIPTPEWLAEMTIRILGDKAGPKLVNHSDILAVDEHNEDFEGQFEIGAAMGRAMRIYRKAVEQTLRANITPVGIPRFISPEEIAEGKVRYERGCQLVTGDEKRKRAMVKFQKMVDHLLATYESADPSEFPDEDTDFLVNGIVSWMNTYERQMGKKIDLSKKLYAPHPAHAKKPAE